MSVGILIEFKYSNSSNLSVASGVLRCFARESRHVFRKFISKIVIGVGGVDLMIAS